MCSPQVGVRERVPASDTTGWLNAGYPRVKARNNQEVQPPGKQRGRTSLTITVAVCSAGAASHLIMKRQEGPSQMLRKNAGAKLSDLQPQEPVRLLFFINCQVSALLLQQWKIDQVALFGRWKLLLEIPRQFPLLEPPWSKLYHIPCRNQPLLWT